MPMRTVLLVDDDLEFVQMMQIALESDGFQVAVAVGAEALQVAPVMQPDVILLDINMPGMDGIEVSQHLRDDPRTQHIPMIAISADPVRIYSLLMPVHDMLPKPFDLDDLFRVINQCVATA